MKSICYFIVIFASVTTAAGAKERVPGPAPARVERVIDGDTIRMRVVIWIDQEVTVSVRVAGVDAPELFRPRCAAEKAQAIKAKEFVEDFLSGGEATLHDIERDKYGGRVVARVEAERGDLGSALVSAGLAVRAAKGAWCD